MQYVIWLVHIHGDCRQAARSRLPEHLGMTLENAWKKEHVRSPHFFSELRGRQMPQKRDVAAIVLLAQGAAAFIGFASTRQAKMHIWPAHGFLNHQFDALSWL